MKSYDCVRVKKQEKQNQKSIFSAEAKPLTESNGKGYYMYKWTRWIQVWMEGPPQEFQELNACKRWNENSWQICQWTENSWQICQ